MHRIYPYRSKRKYSESEGINVDNTFDIECQAFGKSPSDVSPYLIANEWIAASIAQFLQLPIPPFSIMGRKRPQSRMFASYSFDGVRKNDKKTVPANPDALYKAFPDACTGIVLFDILIANFDRHARNIRVDKPDKPTTRFTFSITSGVCSISIQMRALSDCENAKGMAALGLLMGQNRGRFGTA
jgi:hypothetical protein